LELGIAFGISFGPINDKEILLPNLDLLLLPQKE